MHVYSEYCLQVIIMYPAIMYQVSLSALLMYVIIIIIIIITIIYTNTMAVTKSTQYVDPT